MVKKIKDKKAEIVEDVEKPQKKVKNTKKDEKSNAISGHIQTIVGCLLFLFVGIGFIQNVASFPDVEATTLKKALNYFDKEFPATSTFAILMKHIIDQANGVFTMSHTYISQIFNSINMKNLNIAVDSAGKIGSKRNAYSSFMDIPYVGFGSILSLVIGTFGSLITMGASWLIGFLSLGGALLGINVPSNVTKETFISSILSYLPFVMALGSALVSNNDKLYLSLTNAGADSVAGAMNTAAGKAFEYGWMSWIALLWVGWILMAIYLAGSTTAYFFYNLYSMFIRPLIEGSIGKNFKQHIFFFAGLIMTSIYSLIGIIVESTEAPKIIKTISGSILGLLYLTTVFIQ